MAEKRGGSITSPPRELEEGVNSSTVRSARLMME